jgi:hypothetical protein
LHSPPAIRFGSAPGLTFRDTVMANLRWWLLLLAAVMFSMSGCASREGWSHPTTVPDPDEPVILTQATAP